MFDSSDIVAYCCCSYVFPCEGTIWEMSGVHMGSGFDWWNGEIGEDVLIETGLGCVRDGVL